MDKFVRLLHAVNTRLSAVILSVGGIVLALLSFEHFGQVVARRIGHATNWGDELLTVGILWVCLLPVSILLQRRRHIKFDLLYEHYPDKVKRVFDKVNDSFVLITCIVFLVFTCLFAVQLRIMGASTESSLNTPDWIPCLAMAVGLVFAILAMLEILMRKKE